MYPREYFDTYWRPTLKNEIFVIMSFAPEFEQVWTHAIRPAIEQDTPGQPFAHGVDATTLAGSIITEILDGVAHAKLSYLQTSPSARQVYGPGNGTETPCMSLG
jgi:hypothetical protein